MWLFYDYKGSDEYEGKCILVVGGFILNNCVNGVFVVIWVLGDIYMKELVIGYLYIMEIVL